MAVLLKKFVCYVLVLFAWCAAPGVLHAFQGRCGASKITVSAEQRSELEAVCSAVQAGREFLGSIGLDYSGSLTIALVKTISGAGHASVVGQYDARSNEIRLLDYGAVVARSAQSPPAFGIPMNRDIWRGYVVHELAHAAAQQKFRAGVPVCTASEYIASVSLIATLPTAERDQIISHYPELSGFENIGEITFGYYLLDPSRFSVNAYLHFSKPGNGGAFIGKLLREGLPD